MRFVKRLGYYILGVSIGIVFLAYFLKGKNTEFCYAPNCRVLKNINGKKITWNSEVHPFIAENHIDSSQIREILKEGNVLFSKSKPRKMPCPEYIIAANVNDTALELSIKNCDTIAFIENIKIIPHPY